MPRLGGKAATWALFGLALAASVLFAIIALVTFGDLTQVQFQGDAGHPGAQLNGPLAACFMAAVLTAVRGADG